DHGHHRKLQGVRARVRGDPGWSEPRDLVLRAPHLHAGLPGIQRRLRERPCLGALRDHRLDLAGPATAIQPLGLHARRPLSTAALLDAARGRARARRWRRLWPRLALHLGATAIATLASIPWLRALPTSLKPRAQVV